VLKGEIKALATKMLTKKFIVSIWGTEDRGFKFAPEYKVFAIQSSQGCFSCSRYNALILILC
jgi:hypothetical protein